MADGMRSLKLRKVKTPSDFAGMTFVLINVDRSADRQQVYVGSRSHDPRPEVCNFDWRNFPGVIRNEIDRAFAPSPLQEAFVKRLPINVGIFRVQPEAALSIVKRLMEHSHARRIRPARPHAFKHGRDQLTQPIVPIVSFQQ